MILQALCGKSNLPNYIERGRAMSNEITVKLKCSIEEIQDILKKSGFNVIRKFRLDDTYFVHESIDLNTLSFREILNYAVLLRNIKEDMPFKQIYKLTFKKKEIDKDRNNS